jgi:hypothetical protein
MSRLEAVKKAGELGLYVLLAGNDELRTDVVVTTQSLPAETNVPIGTTIELKFADMKAAD